LKNRKFHKWIIFIIIIITVIIAALFLVKNQKSNKQAASSTEDVIVKDNVHVIDENNAPDQITDNSLVYDEKPEYKEGDVLVAGIIDGAEDGFIRRVTNIEKRDGDYIVETEPALLTDVFEKVDFTQRYALTEDGMQEVGFQEGTNAGGGVINNAMIQTNGPSSAIRLSDTEENLSDSEEDEADYQFNFSKEIKKDPFVISCNGGFSVWEDVTLQIDRGLDIKCGIALNAKAGVTITGTYTDSKEGELSETILSTPLGNYEIILGGIPIVITNRIDTVVEAQAKIDGKIETTYNPTVESKVGFLYDSKKGKVKPIKSFEKNVDGLQWNTEATVSGNAYAQLNLHYIAKFYGCAGADMSAGIYGSAEGNAKFVGDGTGKGELSGSMDLAVGPKLQGGLILEIPVFTKDAIELTDFDLPLEPFWSKNWEGAASYDLQDDKNTDDTSQENDSSQTEIGNLGTTYKTRFADVNQIDASRFQFDIPFGWKVESEEVGTIGDAIQEKVVITNHRGATVTYWDLSQPLGAGSGVVMAQANISKAADSDFVTGVRDPESEADLAETEKYMVARVHIVGELNPRMDSDFSPADATFFALVPTSYLGDREFMGQAGDVDEFSFNYLGLHAFIAEAPDGQFTGTEEQEVIQILQSFKEI